MLDERLLAAANYVRRSSPTVDVGTDHGYLAAYLINSGITDKVVACDINEKPLAAARKTFENEGIVGKVELLLSNGLVEVPDNKAQDIVICGMGGELIMRIIADCPYSKESDRRFILQPMTNIPYLRKELYKNGFEIIAETPVHISEHFYTVMSVKYSGKTAEISEIFSLIGKISESGDIKKRNEYIEHIIRKQQKIVAGLSKSKHQEEKVKMYLQNIRELEETLNDGRRNI